MPHRFRSKLPSIRVQITLLVLACALPSVIGLGVLLQHFYQRERVHITHDLQQTARALAVAIDRDLRSVESTALALASSPSLDSGDMAAFRSQLERQIRPEFPGIRFVLSDADGRQLLNTGIPSGDALKQQADVARVRPVVEQRKPMLSNLFIGARTGVPVLVIDVPVLRGDSVTHVLSVVLQPDRLGALLQAQRLPEHMIVGLLDASGTVVARSHEAEKFVGRPAAAPLRQQLQLHREGVVQTGSLEGIPVYVSYSRSADSGWTVAIGVPEVNLLSELLPSIAKVVSGVTALLLAGFALAWLMGGHISRSVRALTQPARALASGTEMALAPMSFSEAEEVAEALKLVEVDILRHRHEMQTLVRERTAQLEASKALLENVYASAPVGLSFVDPALNIVMINEYLASINNKPVSEHIGRPFGEVIGDEHVRRNVEMEYRKVLATGEPISNIELSGNSPGRPGETCYWITGYFPVIGADGAIIGITGLLLDITELKRTEAALRQSKQLFKSVVEHMPATLFVKRASDLCYEMVNRQGELAFGRPRAEFLGKSDAELFPAEQAAAFTEADRTVLASGGMVEIADEPVTGPDGDQRYMNTRKVALLGDNGQPTHLLGISIDITERKRADAALQATAQRLQRSNAFVRTVTDNLPGMVAYWDAELRCHFANKYFAEWVGKPSSELIGSTARKILGSRILAANREHIAGALAGQAQSFAAEVWLGSDEQRHVWANLIPDLDEHGHARGFFVLVSDVTELKRSALRQVELNEELVRARDKAEAASRAKSDFLANMSHEIRTPMNAIIGLARLLEEAPLARRERSYVGKIQLATQSLLGVVNDVLDFSKIEAGQLELEQAPFKLDHILTSIAVLAGTAAWDKGVEPVFSIAPDVPMELVGDAMRLQQVLLNLMSNAVKFTEQGEAVLGARLLDSDADRVTLEFSLRDTGIGITLAQQLTIFDAFSQGDNSTSRKYGGTGLGLAISRRLVNLMGGAISVQSAPGAGSTFSFTCSFGRAAGVAAPALPAALQGLRVLIVDDNVTVRQSLQGSCEALGWQAWSAGGGEAGLAALRQLARRQHTQHEPDLDLLLLDASMPGMDGVSLLTEARGDPTLALPPVIMMTAEHRTEDLLQYTDSLMLAAVLAKPATPARLLATVTAVRTGADPQSALPPPTPLSGRLAGMRVLLVEDNEINQEMAQYILLHCGARVEIAANGRIAVDMLLADPDRCDAVLMDLQMPVMNGYEATAAIRRMGMFCLPIVAMTANSLSEDRRQAIEAGVDAHIDKPIDVDHLIATLTRVAKVRGGAQLEDGCAPPRETVDTAGRPTSLPGIDLEAALRRLAGNYPAFVGLLKRFENSQGGAVSEVRDLLAGDKRHAAGQVLHRLRGVAANLGAGDIATLSAQAETALNHAREAELAAALAALDQAIDVVVHAARTLPLPLPAATDTSVASPASDLPQNLEELVSLLQTNNMKALTHFQSLRPALEQDAGLALQVRALANAIETLDFTGAENLMQTMFKRRGAP